MITLYQTYRRSSGIRLVRVGRIDEKFYYYRGNETGLECAVPLETDGVCYWKTEEEARGRVISDHEKWADELRRDLARVEMTIVELKENEMGCAVI